MHARWRDDAMPPGKGSVRIVFDDENRFMGIALLRGDRGLRLVLCCGCVATTAVSGRGR